MVQWLIALFVFAIPVARQDLTQDLRWRNIGPAIMGGRIDDIEAVESDPDTIYVGTGETGLSLDSFFGVGIYRIDNASTASPVISGPFHDDPTNADIFTGRGIGKIVVHPTLPGTIFVASASGIGGIGGVSNNILPDRGLYRSTDATSARSASSKPRPTPG